MTTQSPPIPQAAESREKYMTLVEHLKELRYRLFVSAIAVVGGLVITSIFGNRIIDFLKKPGESHGHLNLIFTEPFEMFGTYFKVSLLGGLILAMPVIVYQLLAFVSPGLKPNEKKWVYLTVIGCMGLFLGGVAFSYYMALPPALDFLFSFSGEAQPAIKISSYVDFVTRLLFWTGVSFETPMIIMYLSRFGIVRPRQLLRWWRYAVLAAFVVAAVVTPTPDPVTQTVVALPILGLYFLGVVLAAIVRPRPKRAAAR